MCCLPVSWRAWVVANCWTNRGRGPGIWDCHCHHHRLGKKAIFCKKWFIEITWQENFICSTSCWPHSAVGSISVACLVKRNCLNNLFHLRLFIERFVFYVVGMDFDQSHINMRGHEMAVDELWAQISEMLSEVPATWYSWSSVTAPPPFLLLKCSKKTY